jgi:hypothetical protein
MRQHAVSAVLVTLIGLGLQAAPLACGEKFLLPLRGSRFQTPPDRARAAVLVYANPSSPLPGVLTRLSVDDRLRRVGYRATIVTSAEAFEAAMRLGGWDVVVADIADGESIRGRGDIGQAAVLAVASAAVKESTARNRNSPRIIKAPSKSDAFVEAIDETLMTRTAAVKRSR